MIAEAFEQRWPISKEYRFGLIRTLMGIALDPNSSKRERTAAAKAILAAEAQNQQDEHKVIDVNVTTRNDNLDAIAANLGLDLGVVQAIEGETNRSTEGVEK